MSLLKTTVKHLLYYTLPRSYILMFHHITLKPAIKKSACLLSYDRFTEMILAYKEHFAPLKAVLRGAKNKVAITFDDGMSDVYETAYPFLKTHGIPFTVFIITDFLDTPGYITTEQLKTMSEDPFVTIGSHGLSHEIFPKMPAAQKERELVRSKALLEDIIKQKVNIFAYSHGQYDKQTLRLAKCYDYAMGVCGLPLSAISRKTYAMPRFNVEEATYTRVKNTLDKQLLKHKKAGG